MEWWYGKPVADTIYTRIGERMARLRKRGRTPGLGLIQVGGDPASSVYVRMKGQACEKYGFTARTVRLPEQATKVEVADAISTMNNSPDIDGFIVQLPLPEQLPERELLDIIEPAKDVDCLTAENIGRLTIGKPRFLPCTPAGILALLEFYQAPVAGKHIVVVGRSLIVGRPLSILLSLKGRDATVTIAHSRTQQLPDLLAEADGVVAAVGSPHFISASQCKAGGWIVDVGVNRIPDDSEKGYSLTGDVATDRTDHLLGITPVPGGVGPLTIVHLLLNCVCAAEAG